MPHQQAMAKTPQKLHIKTFGCQMNAYDSERMAEALADHGYASTDDPAEADLVILNTCHIREKAAEKVYSELGRVRALKRARNARGLDTMIAVAGCVAQAEGQEMLERASVVDLVVGPQSYHELPSLIGRVRKGGERVVATDFPAEDKFLALPERPLARAQPSAFITVQEGCDKFCTFCVVPYTRGAEYSRPVAAIIAEAERLARGGAREITLLGQNVNAYRGEGPDGRDWSLAKLLKRLATIPEIERLRYTTSHPRDMDDDLIALHGDEPKLMPYLHLPFQAGSDRILTAMNRKHTAATMPSSWSASARRGLTSPSPQTLLSASPARPTPTSKTPWRSSAASALPAPSLLNIAPVRERRQRPCQTRCRTRIARERLHILQTPAR